MPVSGLGAKSRHQKAITQLGLGEWFPVEFDAVRHDAGAFGQHDGGAEGLVGDRCAQAQAHRLALHLQLLAQATGHFLEPEVGAPQGAAAHIDKLREIAPPGAAVLVAVLQFIACRQAGLVELHHMGAGADVVGMPAALLIGHDIGAVLQHDTHALQAKRLARRVSRGGIRAVLLVLLVLARANQRDAAQQKRAAAVQVFAHQHRGTRNVGSGPTDGLRGVFSLAHLGTRVDRRHIAQAQAAAARQCADAELQATPVSADFWVGQHGFLKPGGTGLVTKTDGQAVANAQRGDGILAAIADGDGVGHEFANADDGLAGAFRNLHTGRDRRVKRHVNFYRWARQHREDLTARAGDDEKRRGGQGLQRWRGHEGCEGVAGRRRDRQAVAAGCDAWELVAARGEGVNRAAAVGDAAAAGHRRGEAAGAVVADHGCGEARRGVNQRDLRAIDRQAGGRIEHQGQGVHQRRSGDSNAARRLIDVAGQQPLVAANVEQAVAHLHGSGG